MARWVYVLPRGHEGRAGELDEDGGRDKTGCVCVMDQCDEQDECAHDPACNCVINGCGWHLHATVVGSDGIE